MTWQPDGWNDDMSEAPKDGTLIDVWCPWNGNENGGLRFTEITWHPGDEWDPNVGWCRITDLGDRDMLELDATCRFGLHAWHPTHWRFPPPLLPSKRTDSGRAQPPIQNPARQPAMAPLYRGRTSWHVSL